VSSLRDISGKSVSYEYDEADRLISVYDAGKLAASYGYEGDLISEVSFANGMTTSYGRDGDKNVSRLKTILPGGGILADYSYEYDGNGNLVKRIGKEGQRSYAYDILGRLAGANYENGRQESFFYDKAGNRARRIADGTEELFSYDPRNRLTEARKGADVTRFSYDAQGNTVKAGDKIFNYDAFSRMTEVLLPSGEKQINRYDAEGLRAEIEENGRLTRFLFSGKDAVCESADDGSPALRLVRGRGLISSESSDAVKYYYHLNEHGDTEELISEDGSIANSYRYDAFGNATEKEELIPNRYLYAGEQYDGTSGQYYLRARFYNPVLGRFLGEDTYRGDGLNLYAYCKNNPVSYVDPSGYFTCDKDVLANQQSRTYSTNPNGQTIYRDVNDRWHDAITGRFAVGPDGPVTRVKTENTGVEGAGPTGGRLGNADTRAQNKQIADYLESKYYEVIGGGSLSEEYLRGDGKGTKGSNYVDITAIKNGQYLRINTVDTYSNGQLTLREAVAAESINKKTGGQIITIPKGSGLGELPNLLSLNGD
jgi:RHS repeat-associated protein